MGYMCYLRLLVQNNSIKINLRFSRADLKWESSLRCCFASIYTITWCPLSFLEPWVFEASSLLEWQLRVVNRSNDGSIVSTQLKSCQTSLEISVFTHASPNNDLYQLDYQTDAKGKRNAKVLRQVSAKCVSLSSQSFDTHDPFPVGQKIYLLELSYAGMS